MRSELSLSLKPIISGGKNARKRLKLARTKSGANRGLEDPFHAGRHLHLNSNEPRKGGGEKEGGEPEEMKRENTRGNDLISEQDFGLHSRPDNPWSAASLSGYLKRFCCISTYQRPAPAPQPQL